jgi:hypothetical protein
VRHPTYRRFKNENFQSRTGSTILINHSKPPDIVARAAAIISSFLRMQVFTEKGSQLCPARQNRPLAMRCEFAERVQPGFEWLTQFAEFSFVQEFTPVFRTTERGDVLAPEGGAYIVMPSSVPVIGEEALFWASAK